MSAERLAGLLARRLREEGIGPDAAVSVAELRRQLLPYPYCRERLELASKAEYDLAMLALLGDPELLQLEDPDLEEAVEREAEAPEPGLGFLEDFSAAQVRPGPDLADRVGGDGGRAGGDGSRPADIGPGGGERPVRLVEGDDEGAPAESADREPADRGPAGREPAGEEEAGDGCRACGGDLPSRGDLRFCPWCGADQQARSCAGCGAALDPGWTYCPQCGERTDG